MFAFLGLGGTEIMVVLGAVLLLFGPKKLPELARGLGKGIREFKKASSEVTEELQRVVEDPPAPHTKYSPEEYQPEHSVPHTLPTLAAPDSPVVSEPEHSVPHVAHPSQAPK